MIIELKYFGRIVDVTDITDEKMEIDEMTIDAFRLVLGQKYPGLKNESYKMAVNQNLVKDDYLIANDCEIALLPPFAGG